MNNKYYIYHYYEKRVGPFKNLSDLSIIEAESVQNYLRENYNVFASKRTDDYIKIRRNLEAKARELFILKGGNPKRNYPHYFTLGKCDWFYEWYENTEFIKLPINIIDVTQISFTYGDLFPTMRFNDDKEYRKQVYTFIEILEIIKTYGYPQIWNRDGKLAPERYIEVQLWDDKILREMQLI